MLRRLIAFAGTLAASALGAPAQASAPPPPTVQISSVKVTEGNAGMIAFQAQVSLFTYFNVPSPGPVQVDITAIPGTATADDYTFAPVRLTLTPGVPQVITGFVVGDAMFEGDEWFVLRAAAASGVIGPYIGSQDGTVTIVDDDGVAAARLKVDATTTVPEGNAGWRSVEVAVRLSPPVANVVSFDYATAGGQPTYQVGDSFFGDYRPATGTLTLAPGETLAKIPLEIHGDTAWEPDTSFEVKLLNVRGALADVAVGKVVVANDDRATIVSLDDVTILEGNTGTTQATLRFRFDPPVPGDAKVSLTIMGGSAWVGEDFVSPAFETIYPQRGATELLRTIEIRGDTWPECDEGVIIQYQGIYLGDEKVREAHLTIVDDDGPKNGAGCPDPFVHTDTGSSVGRPATTEKPPVPDAGPPIPDASHTTPDAGTPPGNDKGKPGTVDALPDRGGCTIAAGAPATSTLATLALLAATWATRLRRRRRAQKTD